MGRRKDLKTSSARYVGKSEVPSWRSSAASVVYAVAAVAVAVAVAWVLTGGSGGRRVGLAGRAAAAAHWDRFRNLILHKQRTRVSLSDEAIELLDECLRNDPSHYECAFWRARDLLQRGSNLNTVRARDLLAGIDIDAVSTADPVDVLYLFATASENCGDNEGQVLGYTRLLELLQERELADFKGLPNIYAGCGSE